ncbi:MAG: pyridoxal 5'-phosphate synthase glutaminase subunit PdxT [Candidatus Ancillula sp.]|jgi:5'-phosphate synthase pdxT subunit|nr:pyridoxal 5'-phosphate synthase glutaminase subunit PdxT [Candidatus Ancillula sp.]
MTKKIGVLALQGAFIEHRKQLDKLGVDSFEIRQLKDLINAQKNNKIDGLIIPGGESTVISKLLVELKLFEPIRAAIQEGLPVLGTCAGMILLAKELSEEGKGTADKLQDSPTLQVLDCKVRRNGWGRQLGSFKTNAKFGLGEVKNDIDMVFIRAPYIEEIGSRVNVLAEVENKIVAVKQDNILATAFHPELTDDLTVLEEFLKI